jgi:DNA (cytosine-5)-methyltransferase 1
VSFTFVDLFAGIGGFHAALSAAGGRCVFASEIDEKAARVYERNWGLNPLGDLKLDANDEVMNVPPSDLLVAGFPCQPFSKSGAQRGMEETRGTLYWNILQVINSHHPSMVLLENVRNLAGPRHRHEWQVIVDTLRDEGYAVSDTPAVFSPHLLAPENGGRPQVRERVFICATYVGGAARELCPAPPVTNRPVGSWNPQDWNLEKHLPLDDSHSAEGCGLSESERYWIDAWDEFVQLMGAERGRPLPGFPLWADSWVRSSELKIPRSTPTWKADFLRKNSEFYTAHRRTIDRWAKKWKLFTDKFPPSRRKLEWQAQDTPSLWETVMHFRPSGIRAKKPTYVPALVAITQTSIVGPRERRLSVREASRLQGLPEWFDFGSQSSAASFQQLGNGVSIGAVWHVLREHANRDSAILEASNSRLLESLLEPLSIWQARLESMH